MGTNYYLIKKCPHCKTEESLHIGKSSTGWAFALHVEPKKEGQPMCFTSWMELICNPSNSIEDEYGQSIKIYKMVCIIANRQEPNPLIRRGFGGPSFNVTWDYVEGEFS